jgi:hypothetical protein
LTEGTLVDVPPGPQVWRIGYRDGCYTGGFIARGLNRRVEKDVERYRDNGFYRDGWDEGLRICSTQPRKDLERESLPAPTSTAPPPLAAPPPQLRAPAAPPPQLSATAAPTPPTEQDAIRRRIHELEAELGQLKSRLDRTTK